MTRTKKTYTVPVARLVPVRATSTRELGFERGRVFIADDFDAPVPKKVLKLFHGSCSSSYALGREHVGNRDQAWSQETDGTGGF